MLIFYKINEANRNIKRIGQARDYASAKKLATYYMWRSGKIMAKWSEDAYGVGSVTRSEAITSLKTLKKLLENS